MKPYGLVLAGGGAKGAYQIGAWKAMREIGVSFDAVAGVSIGSINGAMIAADDFDGAMKLWNSASVDKGVKIDAALPEPENLFSRKNWGVLVREFVKKGGIDASPVKTFLSSFIDEKKVRERGIPFALVTVQLTRGMTPMELFLQDIPEGQLLDYILASAHIPFVSNIGPEDEKFLDGGLYDNIPVEVLRKNGCNRLVVVDISTIKGVSNNLDFSNAEVVYIKPYNTEDLGASFDFDGSMNEMRMKMGYLDAMKAFSYYLGRIYYFEPQTYREMLKNYGAQAMTQLEQLAYEIKLERLKQYSEQEFLTELKKLYEEKKKDALEHDPETESTYSSIIKSILHRKSENEFKLAAAVLDGVII